jgi:hypothetical protein
LVLIPTPTATVSLEFEPGELVDHTLLGSGTMHRLMVGRRFIQPVELVA